MLSKNQMFWLTALPALSGATLRIFYSFLVPVFGGRKWTAISTASLLIPALGMGFALRDPTTSFPTLLILALLCGLGGGNFSSSMANISFFFPKEKKGLATGLNAGIGNLGVSLVQFVVPVVISIGVFGVAGGEPQVINANGAQQNLWLQNAGFIWVIPIALASIAAWFGMNDIADARASFADQAVIFKRKHNWLMCWLYVGTFGSFIGFSAGFAMLTKTLFPQVDPMAYAFLGPLVDRRGAGRGDVPAGRRTARQLQRLPGHVHRAVRADRRGQRFDLPHDSRDLLARTHAGGRRQGRRGAEAGPGGCRQGVGRGAGLLGRDRRIRRLLHPAQLRHLARDDWQRAGGPVLLHWLLRHLHGHHLVVLRPPQCAGALLERNGRGRSD
jgi:hypothetical protein